MKEYIELGAAIKKIRDEGIYGEGYSGEERENDVIRMLEQLPAADVVEVVRCKDCRRRYDADECPMCFLIDGEYHEYTNGNGFCDRGERRVDHEN